MPKVARLGDLLAGHGCFGSHNLSAGSPTVKINGIPVSRIGDSTTVHCCPPVCHSSNQATGSVSTKINGIPVARVGDSIQCGSTNAEGSPNVTIS